MTRTQNVKKKQQRKNRVLLLMLLLLLTFTIGGTATYAWFTANRTVSVKDIEVEVTAVNGLEISADAINFGPAINQNDIVSAVSTGYTNARNQMPKVLGHISTDGKLQSNGRLNMFFGTVSVNEDDGDYYLTTLQEGEMNCNDLTSSEAEALGTGVASIACTNSSSAAHFMAFDIFLRVSSETDIDLVNSTVKSAEGQDRGIKNTARIALVYEGTNTAVEDPDTGEVVTSAYLNSTGAQSLARAGDGTSANDNYVYIWEPNADTHTAAGIASAATYFNIASGLSTSGSDPIAYRGVNQTITGVGVPLSSVTDTTGPYAQYFTPVVIDSSTAASSTTFSNEYMTLPAGISKIRVYFWVEGQDVDTENEATGTNMKLNLQFAIRS